MGIHLFKGFFSTLMDDHIILDNSCVILEQGLGVFVVGLLCLKGKTTNQTTYVKSYLVSRKHLKKTNPNQTTLRRFGQFGLVDLNL